MPWIYLFLPPETILLSHSRQRGRQMIPYLVHPEHLGLHREEIGPALLDEYCAQMLEQLEAEHGRAVHYRRLPEYGWREAAERFKLRLTDEEIDAMRVRSRLDSERRTQQQPYTGSASRSAVIPDTLRALAGGRLQALYRRPEAVDEMTQPSALIV